jgi:putative resolvase
MGGGQIQPMNSGVDNDANNKFVFSLFFVIHHMSKNNPIEYISTKQVRKQYAVCSATLRRWDEAGKIRAIKSPGGKRFYNIADIRNAFGIKDEEPEKAKICYARVSSAHQKEDLARQSKDLKEAFPDHEIIQDVGSGINWNRKGFCSLLERVQQRTVSEVVVAHKDRLCRFAFELVERFFKAFGTRIVVRYKANDGCGSTQELSEDLLSIVTVFVAKHNGNRAAENRRKRKRQEAKEPKQTPGRKKQKDKNISDTETEEVVDEMAGGSEVDV